MEVFEPFMGYYFFNATAAGAAGAAHLLGLSHPQNDLQVSLLREGKSVLCPSYLQVPETI